MPTREELLERVRRRPNNTKARELMELLEAYGFELRRTEGSHYIYKRPGSRPVPVPFHGSSVDPHVVRTVLAAIDDLEI